MRTSFPLLTALLSFSAVAACSDSIEDNNLNSAQNNGTNNNNGGPVLHYFEPEKSVARNWNEALLFAIRRDFARPTVHARNLFHTSALMYDLWAVFDGTADTYFLGQDQAGFRCDFSEEDRQKLLASTSSTSSVDEARQTAISFGMYRLLSHRFRDSPGQSDSQDQFDLLIEAYGLNRNFRSADISDGDPRALGRYLANCVIEYGLRDGSNEENDYGNLFYRAVNEPLEVDSSRTPGLLDPNRWQPLVFRQFFDQGGNLLNSQPDFLGAEWGRVTPFALSETDCTIQTRDGFDYRVCLDPGAPALLEGPGALPEEYIWGHALVALWSGHLDPTDGVLWDISPRNFGNTATSSLPTTIEELRNFYDPMEGEVFGGGHPLNPATGEPYATNIVPRGDYTRVLAEFWADGPDSETPPGHWFSIANEAVSDHPDFVRRYRGQGSELNALEWDVKLYFALGGAMHDSAVAAWGIKGWYDYVRPISAIKYMASQGQSTDLLDMNYHPHGLPLVEGRIELVRSGDPLAGDAEENVGKIKIHGWLGPNVIDDPEVDVAGVGWILADLWWTYQRPNFVTPPFAGYVSGHSTFSRAAAEVLTSMTGDAFFPGGMGVFEAKKDEFLVFENGPSVEVVLQWATYRDASDQTSLSRIWGGIHPPVDDIPGRLIGIEVAEKVLSLSDLYFQGTAR